MYRRKTVQVLALWTPGTHTPSKMEAEEGPIDAIRFGISCIARDVATARGCGVEAVLVFAITTRPFVIPQVVGIAGLRRRL